MKSYRKIEDKPDVDLTPMLDVVFILLIFFIVTATFISEKSLAIHVPEANPKHSEKGEGTVLILLDSEDQIYIDGRKIDKLALPALIVRKKAENESAAFVLRAHSQATAQAYVVIADAIRKAKGGQVRLVPFEN